MYRFLILLPLLCLACDQAGDQRSEAPEAITESAAFADEEIHTAADLEIVPPQSTVPPPPPEVPQAADRRLIRTAEMRLQVADLDSAGRAVQALVAREGGFVAQSEFTNSSYQLVSNLTLRIPADRFEAVLSGVGRIGSQLDYQRVNTQDVTEEWVDLESRLATKRAIRDRYIEILRNRAQTAEDILNAEDKIRVITEEIEAREARLRSLRDRVAFSTIRLELYQEKRVENLPSKGYRVTFWHQIGSAFVMGWDFVKNFMLFLIAIWPLWLTVPLLVYGWRRWRNG